MAAMIKHRIKFHSQTPIWGIIKSLMLPKDPSLVGFGSGSISSFELEPVKWVSGILFKSCVHVGMYLFIYLFFWV